LPVSFWATFWTTNALRLLTQFCGNVKPNDC
jgi:hypothetical protein